MTILRVFSYSSEKNGSWKWCCTRQPKVVLWSHENLNSNKLPCHGNLPHHLDNTLARLVFPIPFHPNPCNQHWWNPSHDVLASNITSWKLISLLYRRYTLYLLSWMYVLRLYSSGKIQINTHPLFHFFPYLYSLQH